jgi:hypothetical protein
MMEREICFTVSTLMKTIHSSIAGPFRHENLEIFILRGPDALKDRKRSYASALEPVLSDFPDAVDSGPARSTRPSRRRSWKVA